MAGRADAVRNERFYRSRIRKLEAALREAITFSTQMVESYVEDGLDEDDLERDEADECKARINSWQQLIDEGKPS